MRARGVGGSRRRREERNNRLAPQYLLPRAEEVVQGGEGEEQEEDGGPQEVDYTVYTCNGDLGAATYLILSRLLGLVSEPPFVSLSLSFSPTHHGRYQCFLSANSVF